MSRQATWLKDYQPYPFAIDKTELLIQLFDDGAQVTASYDVRRLSEGALFLDGDQLQLKRLLIDGEPCEQYTVNDAGLTIDHLPDECRLTVEVAIDPRQNKSLMGLYVSNDHYCTQCETHGFRRIVYAVDRPDVLSEYTVRIEAPLRYRYLLSNGNCVEEGALPDERHFAKWHDPYKKPAYLFACVVGQFDLLESEFVTCSGRKVALRIFVEEGKIGQAGHAMEALKASMRWDEEVFSREYDLDQFMIVSVSDFNFGAMENKGLNIFNDSYLLVNEQLATDDDYIGMNDVVAHEYFHNWTGNRITCRDWFQLSLKEGLTVFRDQWFICDRIDRHFMRLRQMIGMMGRQFAEDDGAFAHPVLPKSYLEINNFYTATVYEKGGEVIGMLKTICGQEAFLKAMNCYFERFDGQAVRIDDFVEVVAESTGQDMTQFMRWYHQSGTPRVEVKTTYDDEGQRLIIDMEQHHVDTPEQSADSKQPMVIPVKVALFASRGQKLSVQYQGEAASEHVLLLTQKQQRFTLTGVMEYPVLSALREFSAPVLLRIERSQQESLQLLQYDDDPCARYLVWLDVLTVAIEGLLDPEQNDREVLAVLQQSLQKAVLTAESPLFITSLFTRLPSAYFFLRRLKGRCIIALEQCLQQIKASFAVNARDFWQSMYQQHHQVNCSFAIEAMQQRYIKNSCLQYLCLAEPENTLLAKKQYDLSENMTDRLAALKVLALSQNPHIEGVAERFITDFGHEDLLVDQWFYVQVRQQTTWAGITALVKHPLFKETNPNRVRAFLLGISDHISIFHHEPSAYTWVADWVLHIDGYNASLASRVCQLLLSWYDYDDDRGLRMKVELQRLHAHQGLSNNVFELVDKSLSWGSAS